MRLKSFLLASAVVAGAGPSASAADYIDAAEPIDFVRVCEAAGSGYWVIPGTETCIRIGGYVRSDAIWDEYNEDHYDFRTRMRLNIYTWSPTESGPITSFMRAQAYGGDPLVLERAFITWNGWTVGKPQSFFDYANGDGGFTLEWRGYRSDSQIDMIGWSYAPKKGLGFFASLEESRYKYPGVDPDLIGGLTYTADTFDVRGSFAAIDAMNGHALMVAGTLKLDSIAKGDAIRVQYAMADDASQLFTGVGGSRGFVSSSFVGDSWAILGSARHYFTPELVAAVTGAYGEAGSVYGYQGVASLNYSPAKGLWMGPEVAYLYDSDASDPTRWIGMFRVLREY